MPLPTNVYVNTFRAVIDRNRNATEKQIIDEVNSLKGKKTIIMISHNPTILDFTDRVLKLENGKIKKLN